MRKICLMALCAVALCLGIAAYSETEPMLAAPTPLEGALSIYRADIGEHPVCRVR